MLVPVALVPFAVAGVLASQPLLLRAIICLHLPVLGFKMLNLGVEAGYWRTRALRHWLLYLIIMPLLVPRLHASAPRWRAGIWPAVRGIAEVAAGILLLRWAFEADLGRWSFWLDHTVKLIACYLFALDGGFVLLSGVLRLCGMRLLEFSRNPILAVTPADFWRRYNCEAGRFLREDLWRPLAGRIGAVPALWTTFLLNGAFHEYIAWLMVGRVQGYQLAFFTLHGAAVALTWRWRPRGWVAVAGWLATFIFLVASSTLFFASVQQILNWYPRGGLLP